MCLELFRRLTREYDAYVLRQTIKSRNAAVARVLNEGGYTSETSSPSGKEGASAGLRAVASRDEGRGRTLANIMALLPRQIVRALLHMVTFGIAYFVMLLAMYYNVSETDVVLDVALRSCANHWVVTRGISSSRSLLVPFSGRLCFLGTNSLEDATRIMTIVMSQCVVDELNRILGGLGWDDIVMTGFGDDRAKGVLWLGTFPR